MDGRADSLRLCISSLAGGLKLAPGHLEHVKDHVGDGHLQHAHRLTGSTELCPHKRLCAVTRCAPLLPPHSSSPPSHRPVQTAVPHLL